MHFFIGRILRRVPDEMRLNNGRNDMNHMHSDLEYPLCNIIFHHIGLHWEREELEGWLFGSYWVKESLLNFKII